MRKKRMVLVADAGVLVSAIAYRGLESTVLRSRRFRLLVTRNVFEEVARTLTRKLGLPEEAVAELAESPAVEVVEGTLFESRLEQAGSLMGRRHMPDVPTVALSLAVANDGIWYWKARLRSGAAGSCSSCSKAASTASCAPAASNKYI